MKQIIILSLVLLGSLNQVFAGQMFQANDRDHTLYKVSEPIIYIGDDCTCTLLPGTYRTITIGHPNSQLKLRYVYTDTCKADVQSLKRIMKRQAYKECVKYGGGATACSREIF